MNWSEIETCIDQLVEELTNPTRPAKTGEFTDAALSIAISDLTFSEREHFEKSPSSCRSELRDIFRKRAYLAGFRRQMLDHFGKRTELKTNVTLFFSYRRTEAADLVRHISDKLKEFPSIRMFVDQQTLMSGPFPEGLGDQVRACDVLVLLVYPTTLHKLEAPGDWVRREIETAMSAGKLILPLRIDGAPFPGDAQLPASLESLPNSNAMEFSTTYFDSSLERLVDWLGKAFR